jgi:uncharacterized protein YbjQ (UPF0145 family)
MNNNPDECPNCKAKLKSGLLNSNALLSDLSNSIIKEFVNDKSTSYCAKCGKTLLTEGVEKIRQERIDLRSKFGEQLSAVPVVSIHSPINWDYDVLGIVTGQSATGTGVFSEFAQSFSDFFGSQSGTINNKLREGENLCFTQVRISTLDLQGNAILAADIDYSELGGGRGIIMVCITGTAVRLKNPNILGDDKAKQISDLTEMRQRIVLLSKILSKYEAEKILYQ